MVVLQDCHAQNNQKHPNSQQFVQNPPKHPTSKSILNSEQGVEELTRRCETGISYLERLRKSLPQQLYNVDPPLQVSWMCIGDGVGFGVFSTVFVDPCLHNVTIFYVG